MQPCSAAEYAETTRGRTSFFQGCTPSCSSSNYFGFVLVPTSTHDAASPLLMPLGVTTVIAGGWLLVYTRKARPGTGSHGQPMRDNKLPVKISVHTHRRRQNSAAQRREATDDWTTRYHTIASPALRPRGTPLSILQLTQLDKTPQMPSYCFH